MKCFNFIKQTEIKPITRQEKKNDEIEFVFIDPDKQIELLENKINNMNAALQRLKEEQQSRAVADILLDRMIDNEEIKNIEYDYYINISINKSIMRKSPAQIILNLYRVEKGNKLNFQMVETINSIPYSQIQQLDRVVIAITKETGINKVRDKMALLKRETRAEFQII